MTGRGGLKTQGREWTSRVRLGIRGEVGGTGTGWNDETMRTDLENRSEMNGVRDDSRRERLGLLGNVMGWS